MVECRTRHPEVPTSNPSSGQKENLSQVQSEQSHHQSLCTRVEYLILLSEVKTGSCHGAVVECRTRDPEIPGSKPAVGKKKICQRSNQNNTTINPSAPELNTWNCQRWKPEVPGMVQCWSAGLEIHRSPVQTLVWAKRKSLTAPIRINTTVNLSAPELNIWYFQRWRTRSWHCCALVECRTRDPDDSQFKP